MAPALLREIYTHLHNLQWPKSLSQFQELKKKLENAIVIFLAIKKYLNMRKGSKADTQHNPNQTFYYHATNSKIFVIFHIHTPY